MPQSPNRLLAALANTTRTHSFTCPRTGVGLIVRLPSRASCAAARAAAAEAWGERPIRTALDLEEHQSFVREQLLARCVFIEDSEIAIGIDTVKALDEVTLRRYDAELHNLEDAADPPLESWSNADIDALIDDIKKKDKAIGARLRTFGETRLIGLVLCMGALLMKSETSNSPTSCSGTATGSAS